MINTVMTFFIKTDCIYNASDIAKSVKGGIERSDINKTEKQLESTSKIVQIYRYILDCHFMDILLKLP